MSYQQNYAYNDYGAYRDYGQAPQQTPVYQTSQRQFPAQQQHPMVVVPQQPRPSVSHFQTSSQPQPYPPPYQLGFYQQYPAQVDEIHHHFYYPQSQHVYSQTVQQPSVQSQDQTSSRPQYYSAPSQPSYQQATVNPQNLHANNQSAQSFQSPPQPHSQPARRQQDSSSPHLLSSPDPLQTTQFHVRPPSYSSQPAPRSSQGPRPQQRMSQQPVASINGHLAHSTPQQRVVARVEIPTQRSNPKPAESEMERSPKRRRSNEGRAVPVCDTIVPQKRSSQQHVKPEIVLSSPLTELNSSPLPPTPQPNVDYQSVLLALADEYTTAAYGLSSALATSDGSDEISEEYYALISSAMGCLESILNNFRQSDFRVEARLRLRLATLMVEETENDEEAVEVLSKGIALCERSRLTDLKYAMEHLLARLTFKTRPKAALKAIDKLVHEVEALKLVQWMYTFRFLRVSLSMEADIHSDTPAVLKHLTAVAVAADEQRHVAVQIISAVIEGMVHIRSGSGDAVELAERAMAAARTHQLGPEMQQMPQVRALLDCIDLACALVQSSPDLVATKMQQMQSNLDTATRESGWQKDGSISVELGSSSNDDLGKDTCGVLRKTANGHAALVFCWITKAQLYALGYLLSGIAKMCKDSGDKQGDQFLKEASRLSQNTPEKLPQSLPNAIHRIDCQAAIGKATRLHIIFACCGRHDWVEARRSIQEVRKESAQAGSGLDGRPARTLMYLEALCRHGLGELEAALELYASPNLFFEGASKAGGAEKDLSALATLNSVFILRTLGSEEYARGESLLAAIEPYCIQHTNKAIKALYYLVRATTQRSNNAIIKTKQYLQSAIDASKASQNNQLLSIVMNVMTATFYTNIVGDQAEKSARAGRSLAKRAQDPLWSAVADGMYGDIMERCGKAAEAGAAREEAQRLMAGLPESLKTSLRVETG